MIVTGATGFIGSHLVFELLLSGDEVTVLTRSVAKAYRLFEDRVNIVAYHSKQYYQLCRCERQIDIFYHLAWGGVAPEMKNDLDSD